ncbi:putative enzyme of poly-gamma-glutamate biosynthesis (Capsule formation) CapA [Nostocoides australiense Ben110]|uniref:Putative enzyme of poly-gamma-glutamate biosynthesis (Capsule formation) CapA n=1 Tax=Nostocoides australiense Ben110 TaxID=1193182 RepID=W6JUY8_9MICO|nr:CapA family protein [Tetrasphaera australiensis]CCH72340.1 putative enzyme of poly-gamma-glutamate biosynthesis (Capsule formation) CapA [Tetrasphaera australiensis Ben110]
MRGRRVLAMAVVAAVGGGLTSCAGDGAESTSAARGGSSAQQAGSMSSKSTAGSPSKSSKSGASAGRVTIGASGDLLTHVAVRRSAEAYAGSAGHYDFRPMFAKVAPLIAKSDISICHMETPLTSTNTNLSQPGVLVFNTPHELADAVKDAGYDGCDFASNHTWDRGLAGLQDTIKVFDTAGVKLAAPGGSATTPRLVTTYDVNGVKVAHLAFTYTIYNDWGPNTKVPPEAPWLGESLWPAVNSEGIIRDAKQAKADGADFVVVSMHWGQEYVDDPTEDQTRVATALLQSPDVDLILGTHVHRVQPCSVINGKYVFYGLGNFLSNQSPSVDASLIPQTQEGVHVTVTLERDASGKVISSATYQPTKVNLAGHVITPATASSNPTTFDRVTKTLQMLGNCPLDGKVATSHPSSLE